jgi:rubrerythrin
MRKLNATRACVILGLIASTAALAKSKNPPVAVGTTLENLQTAYSGEMNAHGRYLVFAERADSDGYRQVASLFRALAASEQIHADQHARVIQALGATPRHVSATTPALSTPENLRTVIDGERWERAYMYPAYIRQASAEGQAEAVRAFTYATTSEAGHAVLCTAALKNLAQMKDSKPYRVCSVCGYVEETAPDSCRGCGSPKERFTEIS